MQFFLCFFFSFSSVQWCFPPQAFTSWQVPISNSSNPWMGAWHQSMGQLPLPSTKRKPKRAHASQRWTSLSTVTSNRLQIVSGSGASNMHLSAAKPTVHLTSDSPALNGSCITFTAKLEYPPCQKEDTNGDLVWDEHCEDGTELEASGAARKSS